MQCGNVKYLSRMDDVLKIVFVVYSFTFRVFRPSDDEMKQFKVLGYSQNAMSKKCQLYSEID